MIRLCFLAKGYANFTGPESLVADILLDNNFVGYAKFLLNTRITAVHAVVQK